MLIIALALLTVAICSLLWGIRAELEESNRLKKLELKSRGLSEKEIAGK